MYFRDRLDAAAQLTRALEPWRSSRPLVLAIPRGAVPIAHAIAQALDGDLDIVLAHKLGAPGNTEYAIGAVGESGWYFTEPFAESLGATTAYLNDEITRQRRAMAKRRAEYSAGHTTIDPAGRVAIVVDDGLATGATMLAALHDVRARHPATLICAAPVASHEALERVGRYADKIVCLHAPASFSAVGEFYEDFGEVTDDEVSALLRSRAAAHHK